MEWLFWVGAWYACGVVTVGVLGAYRLLFSGALMGQHLLQAPIMACLGPILAVLSLYVIGDEVSTNLRNSPFYNRALIRGRRA